MNIGNNKDIEDILKKWLKETIENKKYLNGFNLHLNEVAIEFEKSEVWIKSGLLLLEKLHQIVTKNYSDYFVILNFSLYSNENYIGENFNNIESLLNQMDLESPSFYAVSRLKNPFKNKERYKSLKLEETLDEKLLILYAEYIPEGYSEYIRNLNFMYHF